MTSVSRKMSLLLPLFLLNLLAHAANAEWHEHDFSVMGTSAHLEYWVDPTLAPQRQAYLVTDMPATIERSLRDIEAIMSPYIESSEISAINKLAPNKALKISHSLLYVIQRALYHSSETNGAFDITFASVGYLYDYRNELEPQSDEIKRLLPAINYRSILIDQKRSEIRIEQPEVRVDLGGIAKGYAVDQVISMLESESIRYALVSIGGDSRLLGPRLDTPWMVGIRHPRQAGQNALKIPLENVALSTSGDYERYFFDTSTVKDNSAELPRRVHHILDPSTGRPSYGVVSATVIGPESIDCDALSTSLFVLGVKKALALIERTPHYDAILIDSTGKVHYSTGLAPKK